ncbi:hypothetical protein EYF80_029931 [Liparis tanakae]|uniref:Uncharacterized protein n=1 Tax=Liparis tanakae TaxID=230148 RepID=A0A4Z2H4Q4_9TELE|nr:hypothetical protein EYF80_029931 [Liparis tanakae]
MSLEIVLSCKELGLFISQSRLIGERRGKEERPGDEEIEVLTVHIVLFDDVSGLSDLFLLFLEVILDFISAVIIRHFAFLDVRSQIGRQTLPLDGGRTDKELRGGTANIPAARLQHPGIHVGLGMGEELVSSQVTPEGRSVDPGCSSAALSCQSRPKDELRLAGRTHVITRLRPSSWTSWSGGLVAPP